MRRWLRNHPLTCVYVGAVVTATLLLQVVTLWVVR